MKRTWPNRITIVWPYFDYARIADPESVDLAEGEKRVYQLVPKRAKKAKRSAKRRAKR